MTMVFDVVVRSSVILALGLAVMPLLRRKSAALRHWVLFTCLICAAAMPLATWLLPTWDAVSMTTLLPAPVADRVLTARQELQLPATRFALTAAHNADSSVAREISFAALAVPVWLAGMALSLAMLLVGLWRLYRVHRAAALVTDGPWHEATFRDATVRVTPRPGLLLVWGLMRPTIIVPHAALTWSAERRCAVLHHELAHINRRDWASQIFSELVRAIYWFNPLVWITCARMRAECEMACDDVVIAKGAGGAEYASHVVEIARELNTAAWLPAPAIVRRSTLERRVRAMLEKNRNRRPLSARARGAALVIVLAATTAVAAMAAQSFVSLSGTIVDASNGVLPGVKLVLLNEQTQAKYEIQTDRSGRYEFVGLPPGTYSMEAALPGFSRFSGRVTVASQNLQQDVTMSIGMIEENITVRHGAIAPAPDPERERRIEEVRRKRAQQFVGLAAKCSEGEPNAVRMGGNIRVPIKVRDVRPQYPDALTDTEGSVVLQAKIGTTGSIEEVEVASSTHPEFTQSAVEAVKQWEFDATVLNCEPIATPMRVTVNFKLK